MGELATALGVLLAATVGVWLWIAWRRRGAMRGGAYDLVGRFGAGGADALVLAFTTPDCAPCKTVQRPALEALAQQHPGRVTVREVDAVASPELARRFNILTVPSTVVIDASGGVRAINYGAAAAGRLAAQAGLNGSRPRQGG